MPRHDTALGRMATRQGKERGYRLYCPAEVLEKAGIDVTGPMLRYRFYPGERGRMVLQFEKKER